MLARALCPSGGAQPYYSTLLDDMAYIDAKRHDFIVLASYDQGVGFGPCAAIVNDTSGVVSVSPTWLTHTYTHQITMVGGDVQSGGSINTAGAPFVPFVTEVPAHDAMLLAP